MHLVDVGAEWPSPEAVERDDQGESSVAAGVIVRRGRERCVMPDELDGAAQAVLLAAGLPRSAFAAATGEDRLPELVVQGFEERQLAAQEAQTLEPTEKNSVLDRGPR